MGGYRRLGSFGSLAITRVVPASSRNQLHLDATRCSCQSASQFHLHATSTLTPVDDPHIHSHGSVAGRQLCLQYSLPYSLVTMSLGNEQLMLIGSLSNTSMNLPSHTFAGKRNGDMSVSTPKQLKLTGDLRTTLFCSPSNALQRDSMAIWPCQLRRCLLLRYILETQPQSLDRS